MIAIKPLPMRVIKHDVIKVCYKFYRVIKHDVIKSLANFYACYKNMFYKH